MDATYRLAGAIPPNAYIQTNPVATIAQRIPLLAAPIAGGAMYWNGTPLLVVQGKLPVPPLISIVDFRASQRLPIAVAPLVEGVRSAPPPEPHSNAAPPSLKAPKIRTRRRRLPLNNPKAVELVLSTREFICMSCKPAAVFGQTYTFYEHFDQAHPGKQARCWDPDCTMKFDDTTALVYHYRLQHTSRRNRFRCGGSEADGWQCSSNFTASTKWNLKEHYAGVHFGIADRNERKGLPLVEHCEEVEDSEGEDPHFRCTYSFAN